VSRLYELLIKALFLVNNRSEPQEQARYLNDLKPAARTLRRAYRPGYGNTVSASYENPSIQAVYMLRYFPQYAAIIYVVLEELFEKSALSFIDEVVYLSLFGCGPAPELLGIMQFVKRRFPKSQRVVGHLFDVASEQWATCRGITLEHLIPSIWDKALFEACAVPLDFTQPSLAPDLIGAPGAESVIAKASLITFQNCLNELHPASLTAVSENIIALLQRMKSGGVLLVLDRQGYPNVVNLLREVATVAMKERLAEVVIPVHEQQYDCEGILNNMPSILTENLLVRRPTFIAPGCILPEEDGLICSRWVKCVRLALRRV
jgi:hypothetical protein